MIVNCHQYTIVFANWHGGMGKVGIIGPSPLLYLIDPIAGADALHHAVIRENLSELEATGHCKP